MSYITTILFVTTCIALSTTNAELNTAEIVSARIETCRGCSLNRLPEVKKFVMEDAPFYDRVEVKFITGAPPEIAFLDKDDKEVQRILLSEMNRQQCNDVLTDRGFVKKFKNEEF